MSRSIHHTLRNLFHGKSREEVDRMVEDEDPDLLEYYKKHNYRKRIRNLRQLKKFAVDIGEEFPEALNRMGNDEALD